MKDSTWKNLLKRAVWSINRDEHEDHALCELCKVDG